MQPVGSKKAVRSPRFDAYAAFLLLWCEVWDTLATGGARRRPREGGVAAASRLSAGPAPQHSLPFRPLPPPLASRRSSSASEQWPAMPPSPGWLAPPCRSVCPKGRGSRGRRVVVTNKDVRERAPVACWRLAGRLDDLVDELFALNQRGAPLIFKRTYAVLPNPVQGRELGVCSRPVGFSM